MTGRALRVARYRLGAGRGRTWTEFVGLVLVIGVVGGLSLASTAGARRTEASFPSYMASINPSTIGIFPRYDDPGLGMSTGYDPKISAAISRLPLITRSTTSIIFDGNIDLPSIKGMHAHLTAGEAPPAFIGSLDGDLSSMDRYTLVVGRVADPRRRDEAVLNAQAASEMGLHIGSVVRIPFYTDAEVNSSTPSALPNKPFLVATVRVVGVVVFDRDVIQSDISRLNSAAFVFSPALTRMLALKCATGTEMFLQLRGGTSSAHRVLAEIYRADPVAVHLPAQITSQFIPAVQSTVTPVAVALAVFGGIAGLALLVIAGLMMGRLLSARGGQTETLRALGADRPTMMADQLLGVAAALLVGGVVSIVVAVALSPLTPLGPVRRVYPYSGVAYDWTVLGWGLLAMFVVLGGVGFLLARREVGSATSRGTQSSWPRESSIARSIAGWSLPVSIVTGVRFAIEPGRGRNAAPVRSAIVGAVLAATVLAATVTFGASLNSLVSHAPLYGWNWDYALMSSFAGAEDLPGPQVTRLLNHDPLIGAWSGVYVTQAKLDGQRVAVLAEKTRAPVAPPVLSGHGVESAHQIVLGPATLAELHKRVGQTVTFSNGTSTPTSLLIVGTATMPALGQNGGMGLGAVTSSSDFPVALLNIQDASIPGPNAILVRVKAGVASSMAFRSLVKINAEINAIPNAAGLAGGVISNLRPIQIVNFHSMATTPTIFASALAAGALVSLGLTVVASVRRRRRDMALLKALGLTRRQLAAAISWQATVAAVLGVVLGIPLGVGAGRELWVLFAHSIYAVPRPAVPGLTLVAVGVGALVFANLVAALPGRIAARTPVALVLRAE